MTNPGCSDDEIMCRHVLQYVGKALQNRPETARIEMARLQAELDERRKNGTLVLTN